MKVTIHKPKSQRLILSDKPLSESKGVIISGKMYEYGKTHTISKELFEQYPTVFTQIKEKEDE